MTSILDELFYGNVHPQEQPQTRTSQSQELIRLVFQNRDKLVKELTPEQKELLQKYDDCTNELSSICECAIFKEGFRLGAQIAFAVMGPSDS